MSPQEFFQFEKNAEALSAGLLIANGGGTADEIRARQDPRTFAEDEEGVEKPRIVVTGAGFTKASGQMGFTRQGIPFANHHRGQVTFEITTPRNGGSARHHAWLGLIRRIFNEASGILAVNFGPYQLLYLEPAAGTATLVKDGDRDRSVLPYTFQLVIPSGILDYSATQAVPPITPA